MIGVEFPPVREWFSFDEAQTLETSASLSFDDGNSTLTSL